MARVSNPDIPADLLPTLGPLLVHADGSRLRSAHAFLNPAATRATPRNPAAPGPLNYSQLARQYLSSWKRSKGLIRNPPTPEAILEDLHSRTFAPELWTPVDPYDDRIEIAYPGWIEDPNRATDPSDPAEIKPTWCSYSQTSRAWPYDSLGVDPETPHPGWTTTLEPGGWIRDQWLSLRVLHIEIPRFISQAYETPWIGHIRGQIRVWSERRATRAWFAPAVHCRWGTDDDEHFPAPRAEAGTHLHLIPHDLALPTDAEPFSAARDIDLVVRMDVLSKREFKRDIRFGRLTLSSLPTFGRYTAGNAWARAEADLDINLYVPTWL